MVAPLRLIGWLLAAVVIGAPIAAFAFFIAAIAGDPGSCVSSDRPIESSTAAAASFQRKWDDLNATLDAGQKSTAVFTQNEATSRARLWVEENDVPVSDLYICFESDGAAASAKVDVPFLPGDVELLVRGTLILTGQHPEAEIEDLEVGSLPGPLTDLAQNFINRLIDDQGDDIEISHDYGVTFAEGEMTVSGQP